MEKPIKEIIVDKLDACPFVEYNDFGNNNCNHADGPVHCNLADCPLRLCDYIVKLSNNKKLEGEKNEKE